MFCLCSYSNFLFFIKPSRLLVPILYSSLYLGSQQVTVAQHMSWLLHHHHHVVLRARISMTLSRQFCLSFIFSGRSSGLHPVFSQSCCMYVLAGHPAFARPYVGVHRSKSLMGSSLLLQQCPACLVRLSHLILQCSSLSIILTADGFHFFSIYDPPYRTFQFNLTQLLFDVFLTKFFSGRHISPLYTLPQLQEMA